MIGATWLDCDLLTQSFLSLAGVGVAMVMRELILADYEQLGE